MDLYLEWLGISDTARWTDNNARQENRKWTIVFPILNCCANVIMSYRRYAVIMFSEKENLDGRGHYRDD